jgi:hypothetical protein
MARPELTEDPQTASPSSRWKYFLGVAILVALCLAGGYVYLLNSGHRELQRAIAEADRLDPHWRMDELEAKRAVIPDAENGMVQVAAAKRKLPQSWPRWPVPKGTTDEAYAQTVRNALDESFSELPPPALLNEHQVNALRVELERAKLALLEARKLADLPNGRYPIVWSRDFSGTLLPHVDDVRRVAGLLQYDARLRAHDQDIEGALTSCRATLNAARAIGDEQSVISQLVRIACRTLAVRELERTLAQGQATETVLARLQGAFAEEAEEPLLLFALRGERAGSDGMMEAIQMGELKPSHLQSFISGPSPDQAWEFNIYLLTRTLQGQRADLLNYMNRVVELAKLPPEQQEEAFQQQELILPKERSPLVRLLAPAGGRLAFACNRTQAELRCAAVALAVERYRLEHRRWPDALDALVPQYLAQVPRDPFDGKPLRYRRLDQGVVVYSVGKDREDNGGNINTKRPLEKGTDLGFRLWDVAHRRQPPRPFQMPEPPAAVPQAADGPDQPEERQLPESTRKEEK